MASWLHRGWFWATGRHYLGLPLPGSRGRVWLNVRQWTMVLVDAAFMRVSMTLSTWTRRHNPVTPAELAALWVTGRFAAGTLDSVPFSHQDFRDLRGQIRLCFAGRPAFAKAIYRAHRKEHARRHRFWLAMHPPVRATRRPLLEVSDDEG